MTRRCGKKRYDSDTQAARALERVRAFRHRAHHDAIEQRFYYCPRCRGFHLTKESYKP